MTNTTASASQRYRELRKEPKHLLITMHIGYGGLLKRAEYAKWTKDQLIQAVIEDEQAAKTAEPTALTGKLTDTELDTLLTKLASAHGKLFRRFMPGGDVAYPNPAYRPVKDTFDEFTQLIEDTADQLHARNCQKA